MARHIFLQYILVKCSKTYKWKFSEGTKFLSSVICEISYDLKEKRKITLSLQQSGYQDQHIRAILNKTNKFKDKKMIPLDTRAYHM